MADLAVFLELRECSTHLVVPQSQRRVRCECRHGRGRRSATRTTSGGRSARSRSTGRFGPHHRYLVPRILAALDDAGYDGPLAIESFTAQNATIATAASIWRPLASSQDAIAVDGLAFLKGKGVVQS
jgi:hypothetical protein